MSNDMTSLLKLREQFVEEKIKPIVTQVGKDTVDQALNDGQEVIIATATNDFVTRPIAEIFNVPTLIATEFEIQNNSFTGKVLGVPCFRDGKLNKVAKWK